MLRKYLIYYLLFTFGSLYAQQYPLINEEIKAGMTWHYYSFSRDSTQQSINVLIVDLEEVVLDIVTEGASLIRTSEFGVQHGGLAAINGSFFDMKAGGSAVFLQNEKKVEAAGSGTAKITEQGAIAIGKSSADLLVKSKKEWKRKPRYKDILVSGPLLITNNELITFDNTPFNATRHPRTAVGQKQDGTIVFVVIDGRNEHAAGMTLTELARWMLDLGCKDALNLDGGGSSTMWIKGRSENGIVNYPSDNKGFDHFGERPVANAIIIR